MSFIKVKTILLTGIETHVCVINTAIDLLDMGYNVHVIGTATVFKIILIF